VLPCLVRLIRREYLLIISANWAIFPSVLARNRVLYPPFVKANILDLLSPVSGCLICGALVTEG
jgi:hypothetical protein